MITSQSACESAVGNIGYSGGEFDTYCATNTYPGYCFATTAGNVYFCDGAGKTGTTASNAFAVCQQGTAAPATTPAPTPAPMPAATPAPTPAPATQQCSSAGQTVATVSGDIESEVVPLLESISFNS